MNLPRTIGLLSAALFLSACGAQASTISLGLLSYDTFLAGAGNAAGVNAFNIANFTGAFGLPPDFPATDDLTFASAVLTVTRDDLTQTVFTLGDIGPGFLLDIDGNPLVQVSGSENFIQAELTATLTPGAFLIFGGHPFVSDSSALDVLLLPSSGTNLSPDLDNVLIDVSGSEVTAATPEPWLGFPLGAGLLLLLWRRSA